MNTLFATLATGLQAGMALATLYFTVRIALMRLTPGYVYWIFSGGIAILIIRYIQLIVTFSQYTAVFTTTVLLLNTALPLSLVVGFGSIYRLLKQKGNGY